MQALHTLKKGFWNIARAMLAKYKNSDHIDSHLFLSFSFGQGSLLVEGKVSRMFHTYFVFYPCFIVLYLELHCIILRWYNAVTELIYLFVLM